MRLCAWLVVLTAMSPAPASGPTRELIAPPLGAAF